MYRIYYFITRTYFRQLKRMRQLEHYANGKRNESVFHKKYGKGIKCVIVNCWCKNLEWT